jgi:hypothetical protein
MYIAISAHVDGLDDGGHDGSEDGRVARGLVHLTDVEQVDVEQISN